MHTRNSTDAPRSTRAGAHTASHDANTVASTGNTCDRVANSSNQHEITELVSRLTSPEAPAFALLRRWNPETTEPGDIEILIGDVTTEDQIADIPTDRHTAETGQTHHRALALVPFRQIEERGFACHDDNTPLQVLHVHESHVVPVPQLVTALPGHEVRLDEGGFDLDDEEYASIVKRIVHDEIAAGEGANFVIRRDFTTRVHDYTPSAAMALFARLLRSEPRAYWTFLVHTGTRGDGRAGRCLLGASPEVHVRLHGDEAVMNPISGTYRYPRTGPDLAGLRDFLRDPKERAELAMVLDEELKMMAAVCEQGAHVRGPFLREMQHLAHTEFEIRGRTRKDPRDVLRETMFAATVTGSPVQNACRVIQRHEPSGRGYYSGALALFSRDSRGSARLDSPILIRTADIASDGTMRLPVGATLVRDSDPQEETAETWAKLAGLRTALGLREAARPTTTQRSANSPQLARTPLAEDAEVTKLLATRRDTLAPFWLRARQPTSSPFETATNLGTHSDTAPGSRVPTEALIVDTGDSFTAMLAQLLSSVGLTTRVHHYAEPGLFEGFDATSHLIVLGPGPGNPNDSTNTRMAALQRIAIEMSQRVTRGGPAVLGVCLGHQLLARQLGLTVERRHRPHQGVQKRITVFGSSLTAGFYNSFSIYADAPTRSALSGSGIDLSTDPRTSEVHALRGHNLVSVPFHPESVLTLNGPDVLNDLLAPLNLK